MLRRSLSASEIRQLLESHWTRPGVKLPGDAIDMVAAASIIRITGGNFRLLNRLPTQVERIPEIKKLDASRYLASKPHAARMFHKGPL